MISKEEALFQRRIDVKRELSRPSNLSFIFTTKDYEHGLDKMRRGAIIGTALNSFNAFNILTATMKFTPAQLMGSVAGYLLNGAMAGALYTMTATSASYIRGKKNTPINHFLAGTITSIFILKPPYIYRKVVMSVSFGIFCSIMKLMSLHSSTYVMTNNDNLFIESGYRKPMAHYALKNMFGIPSYDMKPDFENLENNL